MDVKDDFRANRPDSNGGEWSPTDDEWIRPFQSYPSDVNTDSTLSLDEHLFEWERNAWASAQISDPFDLDSSLFDLETSLTPI
jgi:hypothetical protein